MPAHSINPSSDTIDTHLSKAGYALSEWVDRVTRTSLEEVLCQSSTPRPVHIALHMHYGSGKPNNESWTLNSLNKVSGVERATIVGLLSGTIENPRPTTIQALIGSFKLDPDRQRLADCFSSSTNRPAASSQASGPRGVTAPRKPLPRELPTRRAYIWDLLEELCEGAPINAGRGQLPHHWSRVVFLASENQSPDEARLRILELSQDIRSKRDRKFGPDERKVLSDVLRHVFDLAWDEAAWPALLAGDGHLHNVSRPALLLAGISAVHGKYYELPVIRPSEGIDYMRHRLYDFGRVAPGLGRDQTDAMVNALLPALWGESPPSRAEFHSDAAWEVARGAAQEKVVEAIKNLSHRDNRHFGLASEFDASEDNGIARLVGIARAFSSVPLPYSQRKGSLLRGNEYGVLHALDLCAKDIADLP